MQDRVVITASIKQRRAGKHLLSSTSAVCRAAGRYSSTTVTARKKKGRKKEKKRPNVRQGMLLLSPGL